jgi:hypothetical protein
MPKKTPCSFTAGVLSGVFVASALFTASIHLSASHDTNYMTAIAIAAAGIASRKENLAENSSSADACFIEAVGENAYAQSIDRRFSSIRNTVFGFASLDLHDVKVEIFDAALNDCKDQPAADIIKIRQSLANNGYDRKFRPS